MTRALKAIAADNAAKGVKAKMGSHYERVLKVVRAQLKAKTHKLSDDEIQVALFPVRGPAELVSKLEALLKSTEAARDLPEMIAVSGYFETIAVTIREQLALAKGDSTSTLEDEDTSDLDETLQALAAA